MAFGNLSKCLLEQVKTDVIETLIKNAVPKNKESDDAETRKQAVKSLILVVETLGIKNITAEHRSQILETLYIGFHDYAIDKRGDVGSWVRQETMIQLYKYLNIILSSEDNELIAAIGGDKSAFYERYISENIQ